MRTSIWKDAVQGRVRVRRLNIDGDEQSDLKGHGGEQRAVFVYQIESYRYWEQELGRSDFVYGQFGENLTVSGMSDAETCIGDQFRIGTALFEVTQPRVTCYRLGIRMNHPSMPALVVSHKRPGFYMRVLQEGEIAAGDVIEKIANGPEGISVVEMDQLLYSSEHPIEKVDKALRIAALSPGWQESMRALKVAVDEGEGATGNAGLSLVRVRKPAWSGFRLLKITRIKRESGDVKSFDLAAADGSLLPVWLPGQHLIVKLETKSTQAIVTRNYSLCGPSDGATYRIGVKREEHGAGSNHLHDHVSVGDVVPVSAPRGTFILGSNSNSVVLISAGIGVTPMLAMLHHLARNPEIPPRQTWWIHSARDGEHHPFAEQARDLIAAIPAKRSLVAYSRPRPTDRSGVDYDLAGRIDDAVLAKLELPIGADYYLCGPSVFMDSTSTWLRGLGIAGANIHAEAFGPAAVTSGGPAERPVPHLPAGITGSGPVVTFVRSGLAVPWNAQFGSLLELAEACDVPVKWACRSGVCHACETGLVGGDLKYLPDPIDPPAEGIALLCCSTPCSEVQLDA